MHPRHLFLLLLVPVFASAAPVYLDCTLTNGSKPVVWHVALDESASSASYTVPEMNVAGKYPAVFTAQNVLFNSMEISRTTLSFTRTVNLLGDIKKDVGQCSIAQPPVRKF
ncbi:hypothetical protein ALP73_200324 [Pseudomonas coronafaciens pv. garcae]|uniref:Lipoprotein n=2 Tax=Pseudomonas syringae group TaxID=136849 RepID=A0AB37QKG8_9PSED|nr:hypothetical protein [Pseudomonas coronafaciens]RMR95422.1 hypothetical protein ALP74_200510 [Pseudomonas coronafaciens pv. garcae]RMS07850.1 hypothetical protein ALP73_200324 [Pseudomonas coronafaciens pv. garcae]RMS18907.1 hypothetical protein ALP71_200034 [Pseudomonas coronafaciens pv. garcae]